MRYLLEGQTEVVLTISGASLAGLMLAYLLVQLFWTRRKLRILEKTRLNFSLAPKMELISADFSNFPHPLCLVNGSGKVLWQNNLFEALSQEKTIGCIEDFDEATGAKLCSFIGNPHLHNRLVSIRPSDKEPTHVWRQFKIVDWPASSKRGEEQRFIALEEQSEAQQRMLDHLQFEQQFVHYLHGIARRLKDYIVRMRSQPDPLVAELSDELEAMSSVLETSYTKLRTPSLFGAIDIGEVTQNILRDIRPLLTKKRVQVLTTFPFKSCVMASYHDVEFALRALLSGLAEQSKSGDTLRVHMNKHGRHVRITVHLTTCIFKPAELTDLFHFGAHNASLPVSRRLLRLEISLIKQLLVKQHGSIQVHADKQHGTEITLSLPIAGAHSH